MATTLGRQGCPNTCPFYDEGCYGNVGHQALHWKHVTSGERDVGIDATCDAISSQPVDAVWRHAVTGDITKDGVDIDDALLWRLVRANGGRDVLAYTHADPLAGGNAFLIMRANERGFTLNASANSPAHADTLADLEIGPVVTALPKDAPALLSTPKGRQIAVCPAEYKSTTCSECRLCSRRDRKVIVGFRAHGSQWKAVDLIARAA